MPRPAVTTAPTDRTDYLKQLRLQLRDLPEHQREAVLEEVLGHLDEAEQAGRSWERTAASLGSPEAVAAEYRKDLGLAARPTDLWPRNGRVMIAAGGLLAAACGLLLALLLPALLDPGLDSGDPGDPEGPYRALSRYGLVLAAGVTAPVLLVLLPALLPRWGRRPALVGVAVVTTLAAVTLPSVGWVYVPLAVHLWATVATLSALGRGHTSPLAVRVGRGLAVGSLLLPLAGAVGLVGSGAVQVEWGWPVVAAFLLGVLALAALLLFGTRAGYAGLALLGAVLLGVSCTALDMFSALLWWVGGTWLTGGLLGLTLVRVPHLDHSRPTTTTA